jgi:glycosyltransferase involved in cell wall biosynthesis
MRDMAGRGFAFITTLAGYPWGGSEELWSRAALALAAQGFPVGASLPEWPAPHERVLGLMQGGVDVRFRPRRYSLGRRIWRKTTRERREPLISEVDRWLAARPAPSLVVLGYGDPFPQLELVELCAARNLPFVTVAQANPEDYWLADDRAARFRVALPKALRCYFVSQANRRLAEKQLGADLPNAEVVWNPFNIAFDARPPWPALEAEGELQLACVARLEPQAKGQDLLLQALARPIWAERKWRLNLYGAGPSRDVLERLARRLGLADRVRFAGHRPVEEIWPVSHVLVLPSRYEGLPLAMVEAMLCARPVVATDVAGHAEIVEDGVTGFLADAATVASLERALERMWARRGDLERMGEAASRKIRALVPADPIRTFTEKLKAVAREPRAVEVNEAGRDGFGAIATRASR